MLFCPFPTNLDGGLLDDYTLGLRSFFKSGKITEISILLVFFFDISISVFFQYRNSLSEGFDIKHLISVLSYK